MTEGWARIGAAYPPRPSASLVVETPADGAHCLALLPDGDTCVVGADNDGELYVASLREGRVTRTLRAHTAAVNAVAPADGGRLLLSGSQDGTVRVWDTATWTVQTVLDHPGDVWSVAAAGLTAVCGTSGYDDGVALVWDLVTGECRAVLADHPQGIASVAIDPGGRRAATIGEYGDVLLWDIAEPVLDPGTYRVLMKEFEPAQARDFAEAVLLENGRTSAGTGHIAEPTTAAFDGEGRLYTAAGEVIGWDVAGGTELVRYPWLGTGIEALVVHPTLPMIAAAKYWTAQVYHVDGTPLATWHASWGDAEMMIDLAFADDGRLVTLDKAGTLRVWPVPSTEGLAGEQADQRHPSRVDQVRIDPTGRYALSTSPHDDVAIWDLAGGDRTAVMHGVHDPIFTADGDHVVARADLAKLRIQPTMGGTPWTEAAMDESADDDEDEWEPSPHIVGITAVDGDRVLVTDHQLAPEIWSLSTDERRGMRGDQAGDSSSAAVMAGRYALIATSRHTEDITAVQCWNLDRGELLWTRSETGAAWPSHGWVAVLDETMAVLPTGHGDDLALLVIDVPGNRVLRRVPAPDVKDVYTGLGDGTAIVRQWSEAECALALLAPGADRLRPFLTVEPGTEVCPLPGTDRVLLLSGTTLRTCRLTGAEIGRINLTVPARALAAGPDGATIVIGDEEGGVHVFRAV